MSVVHLVVKYVSGEPAYLSEVVPSGEEGMYYDIDCPSVVDVLCVWTNNTRSGFEFSSHQAALGYATEYVRGDWDIMSMAKEDSLDWDLLEIEEW